MSLPVRFLVVGSLKKLHRLDRGRERTPAIGAGGTGGQPPVSNETPKEKPDRRVALPLPVQAAHKNGNFLKDT